MNKIGFYLILYIYERQYDNNFIYCTYIRDGNHENIKNQKGHSNEKTNTFETRFFFVLSQLVFIFL